MARSVPYLDVQGLTKSFGAQFLFNDLCFSIAEGQRVGLVGANGAGKSTLLSILVQREAADAGSVIYKKQLKTSFLEQQPQFNPQETVLNACFNHQMQPERMLKAKQILTMLKIRNLDQPVGQLSGGQQKRVALANVLINEPDFLILDEPTNHLDIDMIEWLEEFLQRANKTLLMVTHDRFFLDRVCNQIIELDGGNIYTYRGNYAYYLDKHQQRTDSERAQLARTNNLYRKELEWMKRMPQARGHKAKYREDAFKELEMRARTRIEDRQMRLKTGNVYIGSKIFECQYVSKAYGDNVILKDFYYNFSRFEKMGIVGNNGTGKSTFVKMLMGLEPTDSGTFDIGSTVRFGYFAQEGLSCDEHKRVIDVVSDISDSIDIGMGRQMTAAQFLQYFLFTPEQQYNYVYKLSGGEKRKLHLCTVLMKNPNFLLLDEPTNDLDIQTLQVLEEFLQNFAGCVIVISHDRYFMDKVIDHLLVFKGSGEVYDFPGNYTQYRTWNALRSKDERHEERPVQVKSDYHHNERRKMSFKEKREFEELDNAIGMLETEQKELEMQLCSGALSVEEITIKGKRLAVLKEELDAKSVRWLELSELA